MVEANFASDCNKPALIPLVPKQSVRYLEVWLDATLKFKIHAQQVVKRGQKLANCISRLNNTLHGLTPAQASKVTKICGVVIVMYIVEV